MLCPACFRSKREHLLKFYGLLPESQGQNLALTVLYVPSSLGSGTLEPLARVKCSIPYLDPLAQTPNWNPQSRNPGFPSVDLAPTSVSGWWDWVLLRSKVDKFVLHTQSVNPQPSTLNPPPSTLNPQPSTLNPQPKRWRGEGIQC